MKMPDGITSFGIIIIAQMVIFFTLGIRKIIINNREPKPVAMEKVIEEPVDSTAPPTKYKAGWQSIR